MPNGLEGKIKAWLDNEGYPLEMRVAKSFARAGFGVIQSEYYADPRTNTQREIDLYASLQKSVGDAHWRLAIFAECKAGTSKPWVVFVSEEKAINWRAGIVQRSSTRMGRA